VTVDARSLSALLSQHDAAGKPYFEFIRADSMSVGLYVLEAGALDGQSPHAEDEIYVVIAGRSLFTAGEDARTVEPGDEIFVPAGVAHRFHDIAEQLQLIVVFAPPES
jgi:mannose-6-phosphate isomerase-like protein (cupin superfamily)